mgnify:CR=1 FL=1
MSTFYRDALERVLWTAAQAGAGVVTVEMLDIPQPYAVVVAAGLRVVEVAAFLPPVPRARHARRVVRQDGRLPDQRRV